jgi:pimeloyl-ACP methyl ester carboxylesterase
MYNISVQTFLYVETLDNLARYIGLISQLPGAGEYSASSLMVPYEVHIPNITLVIGPGHQGIEMDDDRKKMVYENIQTQGKDGVSARDKYGWKCLRVFAKNPFTYELMNLSAPSIMFFGTQDWAAPPLVHEYISDWRRSGSDIEYHWIHPSNHWPHSDGKEYFHEHVSEWTSRKLRGKKMKQ